MAEVVAATPKSAKETALSGAAAKFLENVRKSRDAGDMAAACSQMAEVLLQQGEPLRAIDLTRSVVEAHLVDRLEQSLSNLVRLEGDFARGADSLGGKISGAVTELIRTGGIAERMEEVGKKIESAGLRMEQAVTRINR